MHTGRVPIDLVDALSDVRRANHNLHVCGVRESWWAGQNAVGSRQPCARATRCFDQSEGVKSRGTEEPYQCVNTDGQEAGTWLTFPHRSTLLTSKSNDVRRHCTNILRN